MPWTIILILVVVLLAAYIVVNGMKGGSSEAKGEIKHSSYIYTVKSSVMSQREAGFFKLLHQVAETEWYIVPQMHLSALLNHKIKGQNWKAAFQHINGKSVDFVLLDKNTLKPVCAIEVDDATHDRADRTARDEEVDRIFREAKIPLVRFRDLNDLTPVAVYDIVKGAVSPKE